MIGIVGKLKDAYALGCKRLELEANIDFIYTSARNGESVNVKEVLQLRSYINEIDDIYRKQFGLLEKTAFDFGRSNDV